jgi:hypothetical protein
MGAKAAALAIFKIDHGSLGDRVFADRLVRAKKLTHLAALTDV